MSEFNITQTNFQGGEWSPIARGRTDHPWHKTALATSLNGQGVEEGAWIRRSGTEFVAPLYGRGYAKLLPFIDAETCGFSMEFTEVSGSGYLRLFTNDFMICDNTGGVGLVSSITTSSPFEITLASLPSGWTTGDQVVLVLPLTYTGDHTLVNRIMTINSITSATITLYDDINVNPINGSSFVSTDYGGCQLLKILRLTTPYTSTAILKALRVIQIANEAVILDGTGTNPAQNVSLTTVGTLTADPVFTTTATTFIDGPYLDPQSDTATLSGTSGSITLTPNGPSYTFVSTDIGRFVRVMTQPPTWSSATTYTNGEQVTDQYGAYWTSVADGAYANSNVGVPPGANLIDSNGIAVVVWLPAPNAASWSWAIITAQGGTDCTMTLQEPLSSTNGTTAVAWQLGLFTATGPVYPTSGTYEGGRLWLAGAVFNRFDASCSNQIYPWTNNPVPDGQFCFSPTDQYGNVNDANAISETLNSSETVIIEWMIGDNGSIICGTLAGEWLLRASTLGDPLTPSTIQAEASNGYGAGVVPPVRACMAILFVQKYGRRVLEYLADTFSGRYTARHLNEFAEHLSESGVVELYYQEEPTPIVWTAMANGTLAGCTYRRFARFSSSPPDIEGWSEYQFGSPENGRLVQSMCVVPRNDGLTDRLFLSTNDSSGANGFLEILQPIEETSTTFGQSWLLDCSPGRGPGNSGYDCGGGNQSSYPFSFGIYGNANSTATVADLIIGTSSPGLTYIGPASSLSVVDANPQTITASAYSTYHNIPISTFEYTGGGGGFHLATTGSDQVVSWDNTNIYIAAGAAYIVFGDVNYNYQAGGGAPIETTISTTITVGGTPTYQSDMDIYNGETSTEIFQLAGAAGGSQITIHGGFTNGEPNQAVYTYNDFGIDVYGLGAAHYAIAVSQGGTIGTVGSL